MPFTPSHAVVALPFLRTPLVPAAIAIGAMTPDAPLFFRVGVSYWWTHDPLVGTLIGLPLAFVLLLVWRLLLRPAAAEVSPDVLAARWPVEWGSAGEGWWSLWGGRSASAARRARSVLPLVLALLLGIWSHIVWDEFTHTGRRGGILIPALDENLGPFPVAQWLHIGFSIAALAVLGVWGVRWLRRAAVHPIERVLPAWTRFAVWLFVPASLVVSLAVQLTVFAGLGTDELPKRVGTPAGAAILVLLAVLAVLAGVVKARRSARHARDAR